jgi:eukaryotic-like serine/threonine-protein kinase
VKLTSMTPPPVGLCVATSRSVRDRAIPGQGKVLYTANAEAVDSSKTLLQRPKRGGERFLEDRAGPSSAANADGPDAPVGGPEGAGRIRISDGRSRGRGKLLLDRYRLIERLGAGGFGVVWRAHDEQLDRTVALKRIPLPSEEDRERAKREALVTARLAHPAIVALYEASADDDAFYLISELVEGTTLALLIAEDQVSDEDVLEIGLALVGALEHAHARGVIHRDVKPQNVLVPNDAIEYGFSTANTPTVAKLADFGGARVAGDDALTRTGDVFGTLAYMAPEQSEGEETGPSADLYSLALVLYEAFAGFNPVRGRTAAATARRIGMPIESLARRRRDLPRDLTRALDLALAPDPQRRGALADLRDALVATQERGSRRGLLGRRVHIRRGSPAPPERGWGGEPATMSDRHAENGSAPNSRDTHALAQPALRDRPHVTLCADTGDPASQPSDDPAPQRHIALPRLLWLACPLGGAVWQAAQGHTGVSLLLLAAGVPLLALPRRAGLGWLAPVLAPVLGLAGLAGAFPALAGQRADWRARAGLAALGFWWLALVESLLSKHLWLGPPSELPPRSVWEASFHTAATQVIGATLTVELLIGASVWALAAMILPWIVRGRSAALDVMAAVVWTVALLVAVPLLEHALLSHSSQPSPRGALLGAVLGCALAVCARALRGPV